MIGVLVSGRRNAIEMTDKLSGDVHGFNHFTHNRKFVILNTQHLGDVGAMHVKVQKPDSEPMVGEGIGKVNRDRGFTNTTFSRENHNDMPDIKPLLSGADLQARSLLMNRLWQSGRLEHSFAHSSSGVFFLYLFLSWMPLVKKYSSVLSSVIFRIQ